MQTIRRKSLAALVVLTAILSTAASCPKSPSTDQRAAQLRATAKAADVTVAVLQVARGLQDTEIAVFNSKTVDGFTLAKHQDYQRAFKLFFDTATAQIAIAKDASTADGVRRDALAAIIRSANQLLDTFVTTPSPLLDAIVASLKAAVLAIDLEV